jgi:hypothetical protein
MFKSTTFNAIPRYYLSLANSHGDNNYDTYCLFFLSLCYTNLLGFLYKYIFIDSALDPATASALTISFAAAVRFSRIPLLILLSRYKPSAMYVGASFFSVAAHVALFFDHTATMLMVALPVIGACYGLISTLVLVTAAKVGGGTPFVAISVRFNLAALVGAPVGIWLYTSHGAGYAFLFGAVMSFVSVIFATGVPKYDVAPQQPPTLSALVATGIRNRQARLVLILLVITWATCHQVYVLFPYMLSSLAYPSYYTMIFFLMKSLFVVFFSAPIYIMSTQRDISASRLFQHGACLLIISICISVLCQDRMIFLCALSIASAEIILIPLISMALSKSVASSQQTAIFVLHPAALGIAEIIGGTVGSLLIGTSTVGVYVLILAFSALNVFQFIAARRVAAFDQTIRSTGRS